MIMTRRIVFTPTIGKTSEGNLMFTTTKKIFAKIGRSKTLSGLTQMAVRMSIDVNLATVGKSNSTIPKRIRLILANKGRNAKSHIVLTTTPKKTEDTQLTRISSFYRKIGEAITVRSTLI